MVKIFLSLLIVSLVPSANTSYATGAINFNGGTWTIRQHQGSSITVKKVVIDELEDGSSVLIYTSPNGSEGFVEAKKVSNLDDLLQMVKTGEFVQDYDKSATKYKRHKKTNTKKGHYNQQLNKKTISSDNGIYSNCKQQWGTDQKMVDFCINQQTTAKRNVSSHSGGIRSRCEQKWGTDFKMVAFCIDQQTTAKTKVSSHSGGIKSRCEQKWGADYKMIIFCIDQQSTAKRNIRSVYSNSPKRLRCERKWGTDYKMVEFCIEH